MVELLGREVPITPFSVGTLLGTVFIISILYIESQNIRVIMGILAGSSFSPAFTSNSENSNRYYAMSLCLIGFTLISLSDLKFALIAALSALALNTGIEAQGRGAVEVAKRYKE